MKYFQDFEDPEDPIVLSLVENSMNSNIKIRLAAVDAIAPVPKGIQALLDRVRDVNEKVRIAACQRFAKIPTQSLSVSKNLIFMQSLR